MSFNPYAAEDFNRMKIKSSKTFEQQQQEKEEAKKSVDHPLMEGKKLDMTSNELKTFAKAMETDEFRKGMDDYVQEISDPKHKPEMQ